MLFYFVEEYLYDSFLCKIRLPMADIDFTADASFWGFLNGEVERPVLLPVFRCADDRT